MDQLTWTPPSVEINGKAYQLRRLGIMDVLALGRIYASCQARQALQIHTLFKGEEVSVNMLGATLIGALPFEGDAIIKFLSSLIGVEAEDFKDPNKFPLGAELAIIGKLIEHEDVLAFFERVREIARSPAFARLTSSQKKSTGSKGKRDGQTPKS
ncbi:MAG: hypothetical protein LLG08_04045 [Actinomycetia bacterium]|nr:hypothetical protein [Actinomycetes bacterium]